MGQWTVKLIENTNLALYLEKKCFNTNTDFLYNKRLTKKNKK